MREDLKTPGRFLIKSPLDFLERSVLKEETQIHTRISENVNIDNHPLKAQH